MFAWNFSGQSLPKPYLRKKSNRPTFVNINLVFLLAACGNRLVDRFPDRYICHVYDLEFDQTAHGEVDTYSMILAMYFWTVTFSN